MSFNDFMQWLRNLFSRNSQTDPVSPTRPEVETPSTPITPDVPAVDPSPVTPTPEPPSPPVKPDPTPPAPIAPTITAVSTDDNKVALNKDIVFQITTQPAEQYQDCELDISNASNARIISDISVDNGQFTLRFDKASDSDNDTQTVKVSNPQGSSEKAVTVSLMKLFWSNHPGRKNICDETLFTNQCAIRMGAALELSGIKLSQDRRVLRRCSTEYRTYKHHREGLVRGHVLAAQELANWVKSQTATFGQREVVHSKDEIVSRSGILFFRDGWGTTDHIDVWDGESLVGGFPSYFDSDFKELWFWEIY